jgi:hypothetical protein
MDGRADSVGHHTQSKVSELESELTGAVEDKARPDLEILRAFIYHTLI